MNKEEYIDKRNTFPAMVGDIEITGDISNVMSREEWIYLRSSKYSSLIAEVGFYDGVQYVRFHNLFTLEDVKNKIKELCKKENNNE